MKLLLSDVVVIGGGAAGFFAALAAQAAAPSKKVVLIEKSAVFLSKVRISGGGRCNVTHACFDPQKLILNYPRGGKELLGPFYRFQPKDTIEWFENRGVSLKREDDGRMFPTTNQSQTIIDALLKEASKLGIQLLTRLSIVSIIPSEEGFCIQLKDGTALRAKKVILATGSSSEGHQFAQSLGHTIRPPVPSLFTFNVPQSRLSSLSGVTMDDIEVSLPALGLKQRGPLLITHFGFSGPSVLKLSAWAARELHAVHYATTLQINWIPSLTFEALKHQLKSTKTQTPTKTVGSLTLLGVPRNLWRTMLAPLVDKTMAHLSNSDIEQVCTLLQRDRYQMEGKTTHKEEFVTCGGVVLKEIDFKTMQSKIVPGLFFAGEILDIDGITGGFNFQNAWTTGFVAGSYFGAGDGY